MEKSKITEFEIINEIGIISLNNPPSNYLDEPDFVDQNELTTWLSNNEIKGLIISSKIRHFSAGANKNKIYENSVDQESFQNKMEMGISLLNFIENLPIPSISCITGACFGGGLEIALCSNIRICSNNSLFSFPEPDLGLIPGLGGISRLKRLISDSKLLEFVLSSDIIDAPKALSMNLVDHITEKNDELNFSMDLMKKMTSGRDIDVIKSIIKSLHNFGKTSFEQAVNEEMRMFCKLAYKESMRRLKDLN